MKTKTNKAAEKSQTSSPFFPANSNGGFLNIQAKLTVGEPDDHFEAEADNLAEKIVQQPSAEQQSFFPPAFSTPVQRMPKETIQENPVAVSLTPEIQKQREEDDEPIQMKAAGEENKNNQERELNPNTENRIRGSIGSGIPMDTPIRTKMENGFGANFGDVKIHTDQTAVELNRQLGAQAFTTGSDIYFNSGKYRPESLPGTQLLAHELTHTLQQGATSAISESPAIQRWPWDSGPEQTPEEELAEEKREFRSQNYGPITYTRTETSGSGFDASYFPAQSRLNVTVRGKVRFADTLIGSPGAYSSPNHFMNTGGFIPIMNGLPPEVQAQILPYFQWTDAQKEIHMLRFRANLAAATALWQDTGMSFQVSETGWEDVTATPTINLEITEGDAVTNTREGGPFGLFTVTDEATSDHVQIEIVKQPSADDVANITRIITESGAPTAAPVTNGMISGVRSYLGNDPGSRNSNPQGFNNLMSLESDRSDDPENQYFYEYVNFANNESELSETESAKLDVFFSDPMILLDNAGRSVEIDLTGYASAPGSAAYNQTLVQSRLTSVQSYVDTEMESSELNTNISTQTQTNDSDTSAEADLAANPTTHDPADYRRVDIMITRPGRGGQNVFAHELGHVFGLGDEYAEVGSGYNRPAGSTASHDQLARDAGVTGGAVVGNDDRMMSTGNVVGAAHYSTFADALNQLTSKSWRIVTS
ncbi:MAG: DUF4157 domain-containing protein [Bacteroidota bacterium]|nr:DUF4157 domain-containing protein [Bacteroidota bacterium]